MQNKIKEFIESIQIKSKSWEVYSSLSGKVAIWNTVIGGKLNYIHHWMEFSTVDAKKLDDIARSFLVRDKWKKKDFILSSKLCGEAGLISKEIK